MKIHYQSICVSCLYQHKETPSDSIFQGVQLYEEVLKIIEKVKNNKEHAKIQTCQEDRMRKAMDVMENISKEKKKKVEWKEHTNPRKLAPPNKGTNKESIFLDLDPE